MRGLALSLGFALLVAAFWFGGIVARFTPHPTTGLSRDLYAQFYPRYEYGAQALWAGRLPLWNPHELCGTPFLAGAQSGVLDPLIALAFGLAPGPAGLHVHFLLHFLLTGIATYLFCRAAGVGWQGAALATVAWTFSPALTRSLYQPNRIACLAWLPAIFWAGDRMRRLGTPASAAVLALTLAAQAVAGYPEFTLDTALLLGVALATRRPGWPTVRVLVLLAAAGLVGMLLAGAQLVPTAELVRESARAETTARPTLVPGLGVLETFFGLPRDTGLVFLGMLPALYVGVLPLALAVVAPVVGRVPLAVPLTVSAATCTLGVVAYRYLHLLPFYRLTRFALPWALLLPFFTAVLMGIGWDGIVAGATGHRRVLGMLVLVGVLFLVFGTPVSAVLALVATALLLLAVRRPDARRVLFAAAVVVVLADLFATLPQGGGIDPFPPLPRSATTQALVEALRARGPEARFLGVAESYMGLAVTDGLYSIIGLEHSAMPRRPARIADYWNLGIAADMPLRLDRLATSKPLLDLMAVAYVSGPARWTSALEDAGFVPVIPPSGAAHGLWRNPDALPRAFVVRRGRVVDGEGAAFAAVTARDFRPGAEAILEEPLARPLPAVPLGADERAHVLRDGAEEVAIETSVAEAALLVLSDSYFPGWTATVDGSPVRILRADYAYRAVEIPAGRHVVTFVYRPASFRTGAAASALGLVLVAATLAIAGRGRRAVAARPREVVADGPPRVESRGR